MTNAVFASGNERPTVRLNNKRKYGIEIPEDIMVMIELQSSEITPKNVTLFVSYEYVPKSAVGYRAASMYWFSIGEPTPKTGCVLAGY